MPEIQRKRTVPGAEDRGRSEAQEAAASGDLCLPKTTFTAGAAVIGAILVTAFVICCILCMRLTNKNGKNLQSETEMKF